MKKLFRKILLISFSLSVFAQAKDNIQRFHGELVPISYLPPSISCVVTACDYADFLNNVATCDADFLYDEQMASHFQTASIVRKGVSGNYSYFVLAGRENEPITFVDEYSKEAYTAWLSFIEGRATREHSWQEIDSLKSNENSFEIHVPLSTSTLTLASPSSQKSTFKITPKDIFFLLPFIGMLGEGGMGSATNIEGEAQHNNASELAVFQNRVANPDNRAERLVLRDTDDGIHLEASDGNGETQSQIREANNTTRKRLKRALEQSGLHKREVHHIVAQVLPYRRNEFLDYFRRNRLPLSDQLLRGILERTDRFPSNLNHEMPVALDELTLEEEPNEILEKEAKEVSDFRNLITQLYPGEDAHQNLHLYLKNLQKSQTPIKVNSHSIIWDNDQQRFVEHFSEEKKEDDLIEQPVSLEAVLQTLNDYVAYERSLRRADRYSIEQQDAHQPRLLDELLSAEVNPHDCSLLIAYNNQENLLSPAVRSFGEVTPTSMSDTQGEKKFLLLYGFNVPGKSGPRLKIQEKLKKYFSQMSIKSMNDYNKSLGMSASGITYNEYLTFIQNAKSGLLISKAQATNTVTSDQAEEWAKFLKKHLSAFDFSKKLMNPEDQKRFIAKNYKKVTTLKGISAGLKDAFEQNNWDTILGYLKPALNLLKETGSSLITQALEDNALDGVISNFEAQFNNLVSDNPDRQKDNQGGLDSILSEAFFRKTSKLGLQFAQEQNISVGFVWDHSFSQSQTALLGELYNYFERKPYYHLQFRENSNQAKYPEAITCSEMRHLGRLMLEKTRSAPDYLLIRNIFVPENISAIASQEVE